MSEASTSKTATNNAIECVLSASDSYIETLSILAINAQPGLLELVIRTQLLSAKNPAEKQVKSRTCIERSRLIDLQRRISQFLDETADASAEPAVPSRRVVKDLQQELNEELCGTFLLQQSMEPMSDFAIERLTDDLKNAAPGSAKPSTTQPRPPMSPAKQMEARANAQAFSRELREKFKNGANLAGQDTP